MDTTTKKSSPNSRFSTTFSNEAVITTNGEIQYKVPPCSGYEISDEELNNEEDDKGNIHSGKV